MSFVPPLNVLELIYCCKNISCVTLQTGLYKNPTELLFLFCGYGKVQDKSHLLFFGKAFHLATQYQRRVLFFSVNSLGISDELKQKLQDVMVDRHKLTLGKTLGEGVVSLLTMFT